MKKAYRIIAICLLLCLTVCFITACGKCKHEDVGSDGKCAKCGEQVKEPEATGPTPEELAYEKVQGFVDFFNSKNNHRKSIINSEKSMGLNLYSNFIVSGIDKTELIPRIQSVYTNGSLLQMTVKNDNPLANKEQEKNIYLDVRNGKVFALIDDTMSWSSDSTTLSSEYKNGIVPEMEIHDISYDLSENAYYISHSYIKKAFESIINSEIVAEQNKDEKYFSQEEMSLILSSLKSETKFTIDEYDEIIELTSRVYTENNGLTNEILIIKYCGLYREEYLEISTNLSSIVTFSIRQIATEDVNIDNYEINYEAKNIWDSERNKKVTISYLKESLSEERVYTKDISDALANSIALSDISDIISKKYSNEYALINDYDGCECNFVVYDERYNAYVSLKQSGKNYVFDKVTVFKPANTCLCYLDFEYKVISVSEHSDQEQKLMIVKEKYKDMVVDYESTCNIAVLDEWGIYVVFVTNPDNPKQMIFGYVTTSSEGLCITTFTDDFKFYKITHIRH